MSTTRADFTGFPSDAVTTRPVTAQGADAWSRPSLLSEGTDLWASRVAITRREGMNRKRRIGTSCFVETSVQNYSLSSVCTVATTRCGGAPKSC